MENKMKNIILLSLLAVFLTSCGSSVQEIQVTTVEVSKTPLNLQNPDPLKLQDVEWIIITKDNANEIFDRIKSEMMDFLDVNSDLIFMIAISPIISIPDKYFLYSESLSRMIIQFLINNNTDYLIFALYQDGYCFY